MLFLAERLIKLYKGVEHIQNKDQGQLFFYFLEFNKKRCILRSCLVMALVVLGELVPRFDLIMGLIGGSLTGPLMFILPPIIYYKLKKMQQQQQVIEYFKCKILP